MWVDEKIIQSLDTGWGELYRTFALKVLMVLAGFFAWFDRWGIDGVVDNVAYGTQGIGNQVRKVQTGNIQNYLAVALLVIFVIIGVYWFL